MAQFLEPSFAGYLPSEIAGGTHCYERLYFQPRRHGVAAIQSLKIRSDSQNSQVFLSKVYYYAVSFDQRCRRLAAAMCARVIREANKILHECPGLTHFLCNSVVESQFAL